MMENRSRLIISGAGKFYERNIERVSMPDRLNETLIQFYLGLSPDPEGRMLRDIWSWSFENLEHVHNYIQWLFPLNEPSRFNLGAPVLKREAIRSFRTDPKLRENLLASLKVMLKFYGFEILPQDVAGADVRIKIAKTINFHERKRNWLTPGNHNFLRLTRILKSLRLLGLSEYALPLYDALEDLYINEAANIIGSLTFHYWQTAIRE